MSQNNSEEGRTITVYSVLSDLSFTHDFKKMKISKKKSKELISLFAFKL
jgi:hypothetical protein